MQYKEKPGNTEIDSSASEETTTVLDEHGLDKPKEIPSDEAEDSSSQNERGSEKKEERIVPTGVFSTKELSNEKAEDKNDIARIYYWYTLAMEHRGQSPMSQGKFSEFFFGSGSSEKIYMYGDFKRGFIFGQKKSGVFMPTHFAPKGATGAKELIKDLECDSSIPIAMSVSKDMAGMLTMMTDWKILEKKEDEEKKDYGSDKVIVYNSNPDILRLLKEHSLYKDLEKMEVI